MPSSRKQINVRADDETIDRIERLGPIVSAAIGLKVSNADLVRLGLIELEKKYPPPAEPKRRGIK